MPKEYYSIAEVAETTGVKYRTIFRLVKSGKLKASQVGRAWRIKQQDLGDYLNGGN